MSERPAAGDPLVSARGTGSHPRSDAELLGAFEHGTLPFEEWDHRAHVRVGYLYLRALGFDEALRAMRTRLNAYNDLHSDKVRVGYHETITGAFLKLIAVRLRDSTADSEDFCERHPELLSPGLLRRHYTEAVLMSDRARHEWVEPDLRPLSSDVSIDDFTSEDAAAFEALNLEWIREHFEVEPTDLETLRDPRGKVLAAGGHIHIARLDGEAVGTVALVPMGEDRFELAKMAVAPRARGLGIGERLGLAALETARRLGGKRVFLESNRSLTPALSLYRKLGFRELEGGTPSPYQRCDIQMEVVL